MGLEMVILRRISGTEDVEVASLVAYVYRDPTPEGADYNRLFQVTPDVSEDDRIGFRECASQDLSRTEA